MGRKDIAEKRFEREQEFESQFFSCEKDTKTIVEKNEEDLPDLPEVKDYNIDELEDL